MPVPFSVAQIPSLAGKVALVTGGNTGIGFEIVKQLASHGAKVWIACRTPSKGEAAIQTLKDQEASVQLDTIRIDLNDLASVRNCAKEFLSRESRLDILVCNAGIMATPLKLTKDGVEEQFQVNHLAHYLLVQELLPLLKETGKTTGHPSRIVNLTSFAHNFIALDPFYVPDFSSKEKINRRFGNIITEALSWAPYIRYSQAKLANILFAREINRREGPEVRATAVHPGFVNTELYTNPFARLLRRFFIPPADGALSALYGATSPEIEAENGWNTYRGEYGNVQRQTAQSTNDALAEQLWDLSEALTRL